MLRERETGRFVARLFRIYGQKYLLDYMLFPHQVPKFSPSVLCMTLPYIVFLPITLLFTYSLIASSASFCF